MTQTECVNSSLTLSELFDLEQERILREASERELKRKILLKRLGEFEGHRVVLRVNEQSPTTLWVDGPMSVVYCTYIGPAKARSGYHHIFLTDTGVRFSLTDFEVSFVEISLSASTKLRSNEYLYPRRHRSNAGL